MNYGKSQIDNPEFQEAQIKLNEHYRNWLDMNYDPKVFTDFVNNVQRTQERIAYETLTKGSTMSANDKQVGGRHYQHPCGEQHWDRVWRLTGRGYFVGCITKYVERYPFKNGIEDLEKAKHFIEKLIELEKKERALREVPEESINEIPKEKSHNNPYRNIEDN